MIGVLLLCMCIDTSALSVISSLNPVRVSPSQTAVLPISLRFHNSAWEFYHVKWQFVTGNRPILVYMADKCIAAPGSQERTCQHNLELAGFYQQRANISFEKENVSLVLRAVQPDDAGTYRVTVRSLDVSDTALVNLIVEGNRGEASPVMESITGETESLVMGGNRENELTSDRVETSPLVTRIDRGETTPLVTRIDRGETTPLVTRIDRRETTPLVTGGNFARKSFRNINIIRLVFAFLVLCILALILGEHVHTFINNFPTCEETLGPSEMERHP
ncbi:uncharacterized protein LOC106732829 isoform X3 [Pelodiscus sinensis]|uniref:uncharacterized protein LOC106732829 isoform X3 n=1 Tax=Pelodiscus sinensis TaxID=13735 RepID=UPI003F6CF8FA